MSLQLAGVVITRQIELVQAWDDPIIHDPDDIRLLHVFRHSADDRPIFTRRRGTEPFAIAFDHFWQIEIYFVTGAVLDQGDAVTVFDLAPNRWNAHSRLRAAANLGRPFLTVRNL